MGKYQGYDKYKDSGVEWLGEIPNHWEVKRLKYVKSLEKNAFVDGPFGSNLKTIHFVTDGDAFVIESEFATRGKLIEENLKQITKEHFMTIERSSAKCGDIIIAKIGAYFGLNNILQALSKPAVVSGNSLKLSINTNICCTKFIHYLLLHLKKSGAIDLQVSITAQPALSLGGMNRLQTSIPPLDEQEKIAQFLDYKTKQIDDLIAKKETLIEKLDEKRTSLISHAVTKGLDVNVPMKDSGIEWLGEIPKHWEVKRLRYTGSCQNGISKGADYFGFGYPFVNYTDVYANPELPKIVNGLANSTDEDRINYSVQTGDIFFTRTSETIEEIGITSTCFQSINNATFSGFLIRVRPFVNLIFPGFSKYYFRCQLHRFFFVKEMNLVTRASLSQELLKKLPVLLPPLEEQQKIAEYLDQKTAEIEEQKTKIQQAIDLLKEYRTALITNAVTGKIDVSQVDIP